jgi:4-amino-4-deoxy-L-arabinose transferase-like glycosyltransferase
VSQRFFYLSLFLSLIIGICNLFVDVMEIDAAQYAEMSWEMLRTGHFLQPTCLGRPYLDKPPLLFWLSSCSFWVFGITNFAYKLPSLLFAVLAVYSVYRFSKLFYDENTAKLAALMLATSQAMYMATNDVRTDTILMGAVIFSIWQWAQFFEASKSKNLIGGSIGIALALLAKGPIGLIAVGSALAPHVMWKKKWKLLFDPRLLLAIIVIAALLVPMSIGLFQQHGMAGLRFYFWTQSFGRITGESEWNNHPDTFFLLHTFAWMILPWTVFFFYGWARSIAAIIRLRMASWALREYISVSGFTLVLISLMLSKYQLPHYVYIVLPLGCVMAANSFSLLNEKIPANRWITVFQSLISVSAVLGAVLLHTCFTSNNHWALSALVIAASTAALVMLRGRTRLHYSLAPILAFNVLLSVFYFPAILQYQAGNDMGRLVWERGEAFVTFKYINNYSLVFYAQQMPVAELWEADSLLSLLREKKKLTAITTKEGLDVMEQHRITHNILLYKEDFPVSKLNFRFLHPQNRKEVVQQNYVVELYAGE